MKCEPRPNLNCAETEASPTHVMLSRSRILTNQSLGEGVVALDRGTPSPGNLRPGLSSIIGRGDEIDRLLGVLTAVRLVTLTGPGGVGKTRLAREVGLAVESGVDDGVWFVGLSELSDPALLMSAIKSALGKRRTSGAGAEELYSFLGDRELLLILDNCEHLADACAELVAGLLRECPGVRVLATSREALRIEGEYVFEVRPLAVPDPGHPSRSAAVALFEARAGQVNSTFSLDDESAELVAELCRRLDGLPLAIELAAASTRFLSLAQLVAGDDAGLHHEVPGSRSAPPRHRSLNQAIAYSYDLCSAPAQLLWANLAVFRGGAELEAIESVCVGEHLHPTMAWRALCELVDKSVVVFDGHRYRMLGVIQAFGAARLRASGREPAVLRAHRDYFVSLAADMSAGWFGSDQPALLDRIIRDQANLRAVLERAAVNAEEASVGLRIAVDLYAIWLGGALPGEGQLWLARLLDVDGIDPHARAPALWLLGFLRSTEGQPAAGIDILLDAETFAATVGDSASVAHAVQKRGLAELLRGRTDEGRELLERAVELERAVAGFNPFLVDAMLGLGVAYCNLGDPAGAELVLQEARQICEAHDEQLLLSWVTIHLGLAAYRSDDFDRAQRRIRDALTRLRTLNAPIGVPWTIELLAWVALEDGQYVRAAQLLGGARMLAEPFGGLLSGFPRLVELHDVNYRRTREAMGSRRFTSEYGTGQNLGRDAIVALALDEVDRDPQAATKAASPTEALTPRELQIAELVATGMTNREIAAELVISPRTVDTHVEHILAKLNFGTRSQVAALFGPRGGEGFAQHT